MKTENSFVIKGYRGPEFFCDREKETRKLVAAIENGRDVTIMAPRRYGKTGLVRHVFHSLDKGYALLYVDIFNITCLADLVSRDLVDRGEDGCRVYDRFFAQWLREERA